MPLFAKQWAFAGHVHQAARHRLPIERGRGAFDHIDAFEKPGIDLHHIEAAAVAHHPQAVEEGVINVTAVETAQRNGIVTAGGTGEIGKHTRRIVQRLVKRRRALILDLLARDHRD